MFILWMQPAVDSSRWGMNGMQDAWYREDYFMRKSKYAVVVMVVNDDKHCIRYFNIGWPAWVHDEWVLSNCSLVQHSNHYFSPSEYILGDSAFSNCNFLVPDFKRLGGQWELGTEQSCFNRIHSSAHVLREHTNGICKGAFHGCDQFLYV
jgi:hypothetical protein